MRHEKCSSEEKANGKLMMHKNAQVCEDKTTEKKAFTEIVENKRSNILKIKHNIYLVAS